MPMPATRGRLGTDITKEKALEEIRKDNELNPFSAPETTAMRLMRHVDSWEEHSAIIKALDEFLAES